MAPVASGAGLNSDLAEGVGDIVRNSMPTATNDNSILTERSPLERFSENHPRFGHAVFCQSVAVRLAREAHSNRLLSDVGDNLITLAEQAYGLRQVDKLADLSEALLALPLPRPYRSAARYFRGLELIRRGDLDLAKSVLEAVAAEPPHRYTARAIESLGVLFQTRGDFESALKLYMDASCRAAEKGSADFLTPIFAYRNVAVLKSVDGDHKAALAYLERMLPIARAIGSCHPAVYYDYLNSLAVELSELGRLQEAVRASRIAISSPIAAGYPEWRHTFDEIAHKRQRTSHSVVAVRQPIIGSRVDEPVGETRNLLYLPLPLTVRPAMETLDRQPQGARARILDFQLWKSPIKKSSPAAPTGIATQERSHLTTGQKLIRLVDLISRDGTDDETIDRILDAVEQIVPKGQGEKLD
jgi:tetratricopeptide (TPR) repeat protein